LTERNAPFKASKEAQFERDHQSSRNQAQASIAESQATNMRTAARMAKKKQTTMTQTIRAFSHF